MDEKKNQKKNNTGFIVTIILLAVVVLGLIVYICYDKELILSSRQEVLEKKTKKEEEITSEEKESTQLQNAKKIIGIDLNKCINSSNYQYTLTDYTLSGLNFSLDPASNTVNLSINWDNITRNWGISNGTARSNQYTINNFSGKVVDIYVNGIGQDATGSVALFLLEDGTVEYIPLYKALESNNIKSSGKISGVEDVIKFYSVGARPKGENSVGGFQTILAQKEDGTFYDLYENLANSL